MTDKPCCANAAARKVRKLRIAGKEVGIAHLDDINAEVRALGLGPHDADRELLRRVKTHNYVPRGLESDYLAAVREEYERSK